MSFYAGDTSSYFLRRSPGAELWDKIFEGEIPIFYSYFVKLPESGAFCDA